MPRSAPLTATPMRLPKFKNLRTSTKLIVLCFTFMISVGVPVYALVMEKRIAIDFARKELVGSRYLATVREVYAAIVSLRSASDPRERPAIDAILTALADAQSAAGLQTAELAQALAAALRELWTGNAEDMDTLMLSALAKAQALVQRIGDDSNLALDPDLDSYYVQRILVRKVPTFLGRLCQLQQFFDTSIGAALPSVVRDIQLPVLASLLQSTAREMQDDAEAAYRGNSDGSLKQAVAGEIAAMLLSMNSYLGALSASTTGVDARDDAAYTRYHVRTMQDAIKVWAVAQAELDRLLQQRIDGQLARMRLGLALIAAFAGFSILIAVLTHRHIVRPLERLEGLASTVRETKDYSLRAQYSGEGEIGRVTAAFNDMLSELAAARKRETAERAEFARVTHLTRMGEMAGSIAHEVNQPLAAIVSNGNAGLRWLANATPDLGRVQAVLQRVVRDGLRASEVVGSVRAMFKKEGRQRVPLRVDELIAEVLALFQSELRSGQISLASELGAGLPSVLADRVQLQQVLVNLISNAIDAMGPVRDRPRWIRVSARVVEADGVVITVGDAGSGLDPEARDRIFDPFFTTKSSGMGLGLSICRSIVEAHGGRIWASPGSPHGSVFQFMLPACNTDGA